MQVETDEKYGFLENRFPNFCMVKVKLVKVEFGERLSSDEPNEFDVVENKKCVHELLFDFLSTEGHLNRNFDVAYWDWDDPSWCKLNATTQQDEITEGNTQRVRLRLTYTAPKVVFNSSRFLIKRNDSESLKKMSSVPNSDAPAFKPRLPQKHALLMMRERFVTHPKSGEGGKFMVILPTGCGKTAVIALTPFMVDAEKVLLILPGVVLRQQAESALHTMYSGKHAIGKAGGAGDSSELVAVRTWSTTTKPDNAGDVIVANIHQLIAKKDKKSTEDVTTKDKKSSEDVTTINSCFKELLEKANPKVDLVIVDEGHHSSANSWDAVHKAAVEANPNCKIVLLTATPARGDGKDYGFKRDADPKDIYIYKRKDAIQLGLIKRTEHHKVDITHYMSTNHFAKLDPAVRRKEDYIWMILMPAVAKLRELRAACRDQADKERPLRMLVTVYANKDAIAVAKLFNARSVERTWGLKAAAITASTSDDERNAFLHNFACDTNDAREFRLKKEIIDVVVQCQLLGEGYDNSYICISAFVSPCKSVGTFAQFHGRAIRRPAWFQEIDHQPQAMVAHTYLPVGKGSEDVQPILKEYDEGTDETTDSMFDDGDAFKSLKHAHVILGKMGSDEGVRELANSNTFDNYHDLYSAKRNAGEPDEDSKISPRWDPSPAEKVAEMIFSKFQDGAQNGGSKLLDIIDFGCGRDGLLEEKLYEKVSLERDGAGKVTVLALDLVPFAGADALTAKGSRATALDITQTGDFTRFVCQTSAGNYSQVVDKFNAHSYDVAVFCLAFMFRDDFARGLCAAARMLKPGGRIYIVLDIFKFGGRMQSNNAHKEILKKTWIKAFDDLDTGFTVDMIEFKKQFGYVQLITVSQDKVAGLQDKLKDVTIAFLLTKVPLLEDALEEGKKGNGRVDAGEEGDTRNQKRKERADEEEGSSTKTKSTKTDVDGNETMD